MARSRWRTSSAAGPEPPDRPSRLAAAAFAVAASALPASASCFKKDMPLLKRTIHAVANRESAAACLSDSVTLACEFTQPLLHAPAACRRTRQRERRVAAAASAAALPVPSSDELSTFHVSDEQNAPAACRRTVGPAPAKRGPPRPPPRGHPPLRNCFLLPPPPESNAPPRAGVWRQRPGRRACGRTRHNATVRWRTKTCSPMPRDLSKMNGTLQPLQVKVHSPSEAQHQGSHPSHSTGALVWHHSLAELGLASRLDCGDTRTTSSGCATYFTVISRPDTCPAGRRAQACSSSSTAAAPACL